MYGDEDEPDWTNAPEFQMWADRARWEAYCEKRIALLWRDLPILGSPLIWVSPRWMQVKYHLKRWR